VCPEVEAEEAPPRTDWALRRKEPSGQRCLQGFPAKSGLSAEHCPKASFNSKQRGFNLFPRRGDASGRAAPSHPPGRAPGDDSSSLPRASISHRHRQTSILRKHRPPPHPGSHRFWVLSAAAQQRAPPRSIPRSPQPPPQAPLTFILSMLASIFSCSTSLRACAMLAVLLLAMGGPGALSGWAAGTNAPG